MVWLFLERYGWALIAVSIACYFASQYIVTWYRAWRLDMHLRSAARTPMQKQILDEQRAQRAEERQRSLIEETEGRLSKLRHRPVIK
jgi:hypothetical protein